MPYLHTFHVPAIHQVHSSIPHNGKGGCMPHGHIDSEVIRRNKFFFDSSSRLHSRGMFKKDYLLRQCLSCIIPDLLKRQRHNWGHTCDIYLWNWFLCHQQEVLDDFQWIDGRPLALRFKFTEIDVLVTAHGEDDRLHARKTKVTRQPNNIKWCEFHAPPHPPSVSSSKVV